MEFRTEIKLNSPAWQISYPSRILAVGSCFAQNIGAKLHEAKLETQINPTGIMYHPIALAQTLASVLTKKNYSLEDIFQHQELWHSFEHHSHFSGTERRQVLHNINNIIHNSHSFVDNLDYLLLTLGTAKVFYRKDNQKSVANCHKLPADLFTSHRLTVDDCVAALSPILSDYSNKLPHLKIILTVSPVRYLREGMVESNRSKATLLLAVEKLIKIHPNAHYFPAYEYLIDDLRDYRFYADDFLHPSTLAVEYIWDKFRKTYFSAATEILYQDIERLTKAAAHRPFFTDTQAFLTFCEKQKQLLISLCKTHPYLDFERELAHFQSFLIVKKP